MNTHHCGTSAPNGVLTNAVTRDLGDLPPPRRWQLRNWFQHRRRDFPKTVSLAMLGRITGLVPVESELRGALYRPNLKALHPEQLLKLRELLASNFPVHELPRHFGGLVLDYGVLSRRVVTTAGVGYLVDALQGITEPENLRYHGFGTGTNAEASGNTTLQTELTTEYASDNTRPTGSLTEGASANIFRTVGTLSPDATVAITEHGLFSQAATGGGTLWDRSVFSVINLTGGVDSLQTTYDCTFPAGS